MTARDFVQGYVQTYEVPEERVLFILDQYLSGTASVSYSVFPDAQLPREFLEDYDEPYGFDEFFSEWL